MPHALIIGAGPAGCVAAILLARGGWRVSLVEQHHFPRHKVCGECLSALGYEVLQRAGLAQAFGSLQPVPLTHAAVHSQGGRGVCVPLPLCMWGITRSVMDEWLLSEAKNAGATLLQPVRCEAIVPEVQLRDLQNNQMLTTHPDWILLADGKGSFTPRRPVATSDMGLKSHFKNVAGDGHTIELFGVDGHYGGIAPVGDGLWNIAFSIPKTRISEFGGNLDALFASVIRANVTLQQRMEAAERVGLWQTSPLPRFAVQAFWDERVIPLGNAAAAIEPVGGEGMGLAMRSAELASEMLLRGATDLKWLRSQFKQLWQRRQRACRSAALVASRPGVANVILPMLRKAPIVTRLALRLIGKHSPARSEAPLA